MSDPLATIAALTAVIESLRVEHAREREEHAREREAARREIRRLVAMVEGLTKQLDELLRDRDEARRAELARLRSEARAAAEQVREEASSEPATGTASDSEVPPKADTAPSATGEEEPGDKPRRDAHGRSPKPEHLPRDTTCLDEATCAACGPGQVLRKGVRVTEEWHYVRAHVRIRRTERVVGTCAQCNRAVAAPMPPMPFERAACTFAMMAWLCFSKAGLFLPLDRIQRDFESQGVHLASSTLTRWQQRGAELLHPIANAVRLSLLDCTHMHTDGTGLLVVFPRVKGAPKKGRPRPGHVDERGYLLAREPLNGQILVFGNDSFAVYWFTETREGHHALDFLTLGHDAQGHPLRWKGTLTADALSAHDCLFTDGERIESGCNAHGLRKFRDDADKAPLLASRALAFIRRIFDEEAKAKQRGLSGAARLAWRTRHVQPIVTEFRAWLDAHIEVLLKTNPVRKAMQYYLNHWDALTRFLVDPDVELSNNWAERALRVVNLIRNNSLYAGGIEGAKRLCTLLTLVQTCKLIGVDPFHYLEWALSKVVPHPTNRGLRPRDLTPAAYKALQQGDAG